MTNVPTVVWIDEEGQIVRPNDVTFTRDEANKAARLSQTATEFMNQVRGWVHGTSRPAEADIVRTQQKLPTAAEQLARTHLALGLWLHRQDRPAAAGRHLEKAGILAPHDLTIRRGTMTLQGKNPMGDGFIELIKEAQRGDWQWYQPLNH